jgi:hypothetical protein
MFQLTTLTESGEKRFQRGTEKLPLSISCMTFICVHESCRSLFGVDPGSGKKRTLLTLLHAPSFIVCMHIAIGSPSPPVLNWSATHRSLREYFL